MLVERGSVSGDRSELHDVNGERCGDDEDDEEALVRVPDAAAVTADGSRGWLPVRRRAGGLPV